VPASTILLIESDPTAVEAVGGVLTKLGYTVTTVKDVDAGLAQVASHQLVIVDIVEGERSGLDVCKAIRTTPDVAVVPILCVSQSDEVEERIRFLEAGADDVVAKPFDARELEARVEALLLRFQRSKNVGSSVGDNGKGPLLARQTAIVFSPKGGVGTTTIATNMAVALARNKPDQVILVDLSLQFGQVATHLNLTNPQTISDVSRDQSAMQEPETMRTYAARHDSGLHVLAAPATPELAELVRAEDVDTILATAASAYDRVIIDGGSHLDDRSMAALSRADAVIFPVYPEIAALKALHSLLEYLNEAGSVATKARFVLNNVFAKEFLKLRDVESALSTKVEFQLPYEPFLFLKAVNEGIPIVIGAPRSAAADALVKLAGSTFGDDAIANVPARAEERRGGLLGGLIRR
jgi:pilus assembly protein CpaE